MTAAGPPMSAVSIEQGIRIEVARDAQSVTVALEAGMPPDSVTAPVLLALLRGSGVAVTGAIERDVGSLVEEYARAGGPVAGVVAQGRPPVDGTDGRVEFAPGCDPRQAEAPGGSGVPSPGAVDHHSRSVFVGVQAGDRIGRVVPGTPGTDGADVTGAVLAARPAREPALELDGTVRRLENGDLVAAVAGVLEYAPPALRVLRTLMIPGDVDFATGNIDAPGDVEVAGGVRDCFRVRARGRLVVRGVVEASDLETGADAVLAGGMAARGAGHLLVGLNLTTTMLRNVTGMVGRHLVARGEVINCDLTVAGEVQGEACTIAGGVLVAGGACRVATLGSPAAVPTHLAAGRVPALEELLRDLEGVLPGYDADVARAQEALERLRQASGRPTPAQAEELTEREFELSGLRARQARVSQRVARLRELLARRTGARLEVAGVVHAGVHLWVGGYHVEVLRDLAGPVRLELDASGRPELVHGAGGARAGKDSVRIREAAPGESWRSGGTGRAAA